MRNPTLDAIADRRSIRAYTTEQVSSQQLQVILDAGLAAPSARNSQPWHFTAVQNAALLQRIDEAFRAQILQATQGEERARFEDASYSVFHHAPTVVFLSCPPVETALYAQVDCGIAVENMALAAHSLGLGSVILGMPRFAFLGEEGQALCEALQFPHGHSFCIAIAIGVPKEGKAAHPVASGRVTILA